MWLPTTMPVIPLLARSSPKLRLRPVWTRTQPSNKFPWVSMTHTKAMLVDDTVILGSANFDFLSFRHQPEIVFIARHPDLVHQVIVGGALLDS